MNTVKKLLCLAVASIALNVQTQGQIKIDDGSFVPKVKELEVIEVIPEELKYSEVLDFQSKPIEDEDLRTKLENRGEIVAARKSLLSKRGANLYNNIVGEVVYLNKVPQNINQFCISADTSEISWKEPIKNGYYTVIVQFDRKNGKNLFERHKSMVLDGIDDGSIRLRGVKQEIIRFFDYYYSNHGGIVEYVLQDETGKLYYVSNEIEDVSLSFYNKVVEMILDKDIYLLTDYDTITDYLTGKKIDVHGFRTVNFGYDNLFHYLKYNYDPYLDTYKWDTYDYKKDIQKYGRRTKYCIAIHTIAPMFF